MFTKYKKIILEIGLIYSAFIWGSTFFVVKNSLDNIDANLLVSYRFLLAALLVGIYLITKKVNIFKDFKSGIILGFFLWLIYGPQTIGLQFTSASNSVLITGLFVAFIPIFSLIFFKTQVYFIKYVSIIFALTGLWFLTGGLKNINYGDILTLVTAMAYAMHILLAGNLIKKKVDPYVLSFQQFLVVGIIGLFVGIFSKSSLAMPSFDIIKVILFLTLFPTLSAFVIQLVAQQYIEPFKVSLIFSLEPVFGVLVAWTIGGEKFVLVKAVGGLLIITAMIISEIPEKQIIKLKALLRI